MSILKLKTKILAISIISLIILIISCEDKPTKPIDEIINEGDDTIVPILASEMLEQVDSLALTYDQSLCLTQVKSDNIALDGTSCSWKYYYIGDVPNDYYIIAMDNDVFFDRTVDALYGPEIITDPWIDSDSAIVIAEKNNGRSFRDNNQIDSISAILSQSMGDTAVWKITYHSDDDYSVNINSLTGNCR